MGYTPLIVIKKSDLGKGLENFNHANHDDEDEKVEQYLEHAFHHYDVPIIDGIELIVCEPELTGFNELVRNKLKEWSVQYSIAN